MVISWNFFICITSQHGPFPLFLSLSFGTAFVALFTIEMHMPNLMPVYLCCFDFDWIVLVDLVLLWYAHFLSSKPQICILQPSNLCRIVCEYLCWEKMGRICNNSTLQKLPTALWLEGFPLGQVIIMLYLSHKGLPYISLSCMYIRVPCSWNWTTSLTQDSCSDVSLFKHEIKQWIRDSELAWPWFWLYVMQTAF